jgi:hypothetical protein
MFFEDFTKFADESSNVVVLCFLFAQKNSMKHDA